MATDDRIEFYEANSLIASVRSAMVPPVGANISIHGYTWVVERVTFALDYSNDPTGKRMRANVDLARAGKGKPPSGSSKKL